MNKGRSAYFSAIFALLLAGAVSSSAQHGGGHGGGSFGGGGSRGGMSALSGSSMGRSAPVSRGGGYSNGGGQVNRQGMRPGGSPSAGRYGGGQVPGGIYPGQRYSGPRPGGQFSFNGNLASRNARAYSQRGDGSQRNGATAYRHDGARPGYPGAGDNRRKRYRSPYGYGYGYGYAPWPAWYGPEYLGSGYIGDNYGDDYFDNGVGDSGYGESGYGDAGSGPYYPTEDGSGQGYAGDPNAGAEYPGEANNQDLNGYGPQNGYQNGPEPNQQYGMQYREDDSAAQRAPYQPNPDQQNIRSNNQSGVQLHDRRQMTQLPASETLTLVFKDGRPSEQIQNYLLSRSTLTVLDGPQTQRRRQIPVEDIDVAATVRANRAKGVDFRLPVQAR